ncbi:unnamed protein product [Ostreobium quekettii]|uniref:ATP-dependent Clp protease proteolytic subunit n=1 Tax=Ostreobium quekettii TaxID=121088 RepID=A0A8S1IZV3_9CHLO|nr:unnamed protein product [Ostreobium quekettii]|eukprot:evm.model.scf_403.7 EVM.evm.TU.scf_403.7   scf_403:34393-38013(-)
MLASVGTANVLLTPKTVIPALQGDATDQTPPDLPSYLFKERIVYLGMTLVPQVTELMLAELLYLQYDNEKSPVIMYINSTGVTKAGDRLGYEAETLAIYDTMKYVKPPIYTICVGTAFGEAAVLLAAGQKGYRASLPSATIMLREPMQRFTQMQATDIDIYRNELRRVKGELVNILATHTGKTEEVIERDIRRPKYFNPYSAVDYGLIDKVLESDEGDTRQMVEGTRLGTYQWTARAILDQ